MNESVNRTGTIAIVEDDAPLREALGSVLKAAGFSINLFSSAEEYLESFQRSDTSCLILDVRLPGMSGVELQRNLIDNADPVPIIFVSAHGDEPLRDLVMRAGASSFLNKPVRSDRLLREIDSAMVNARNKRTP